jgi:hypothetical protein
MINITKTQLPLIILFCASCLIIWSVIPVWQQQNLNDDSYITLTYAKNLVNGHGFIYNHPPATLGTTTPFFALLVALLALILPIFTIAQVAVLITVVSWIGTGWLLYSLMLHLKFEPFIACAIALTPMLMIRTWITFMGMEIWLFEFLLVLTIWFTLKEYFFLAGLSTCALFLTRGEGAIMALILLSYIYLNHHKIALSFINGGLLPFSGWSIYAYITFGTLLPNTLAAKQAQALLPSGHPFINRMVFELIPIHTFHRIKW